MAPVIREHDGGTLIDVWLQPRAAKTRIVGMDERGVKVAVCSPPVEGRANQELIDFFADLLEVPRKNVHLRAGMKSRGKRLMIEGARPEQVKAKINKSDKASSS